MFTVLIKHCKKHTHSHTQIHTHTCVHTCTHRKRVGLGKRGFYERKGPGDNKGDFDQKTLYM